MAFTQADIDTLKAAIAAGCAIKSITFDSQTTTFRDVGEMRDLLGLMEREVNPTPQLRRRFAAHSKGV